MGLTTIDLFAGAGGITEGFRQAGARCLFANDFNADAVRTFRHNHPGTEVVDGPIEGLDPARIRRELGLARGELDAIVGGPPCQGFSINAPGRFLDDPRNQLFTHYLKFVDEFRPKTLLFENVTGMLSLEKGKVFQRVINELDARGYFCEAKILFAAHYGVPQERWRLIILGSRVGMGLAHPVPRHYLKRRANFSGGRTLIFPLEEAHRARLLPPVTVADAIFDLPEPSAGNTDESGIPYPAAAPLSEFARAMRRGQTRVHNHVKPRLSPVNLERLRHIRPGGSWRDIPFELLPKGMKKARRSDHTKRYGRLHPDGLASTIMTKCDPHWGPVFHPVADRSLTVREAARFQSFPDRYVFLGSRVAQYEQVGNAVPPLMARSLAETIRGHVERTALKNVG
ncbi:MAG: DNA cytosine methyltransferase [Opitutales bacterium]|nr:DNA cytosine methyltransferase [Opitutales bacterium]